MKAEVRQAGKGGNPVVQSVALLAAGSETFETFTAEAQVCHPRRKKRGHQLRLYVRRVLVAAECEELCPEWLSFLQVAQSRVPPRGAACQPRAGEERRARPERIELDGSVSCMYRAQLRRK